MLADEPLVFVARGHERATLDAGGRLRAALLGCLKELAPPPQRLVEVICQLGKRRIDPRFGEPRSLIGEDGLEIGNHAAKACLDRRERTIGDLQALADARSERHQGGIDVHQRLERRLAAAVGIEAWKADFRDRQGVQVSQQEFAVKQVEPRRLDGTGHQVRLLLEKMAVVRRKAGAVGEDEGPLAAAAGSARSLGVAG